MATLFRISADGCDLENPFLFFYPYFVKTDWSIVEKHFPVTDGLKVLAGRVSNTNSGNIQAGA
jgi:hypothetical protein